MEGGYRRPRLTGAINMKEIWILGAGKFGQKAGERLGRIFPNHCRICVENKAKKLESVSPLFHKCICMDAIDFLAQNLTHKDVPAWIVPAVPVHTAYGWVKRQLTPGHEVVPVELPGIFTDGLPNTIKKDAYTVYTSIADFICPDNCPEPGDICTHTGKPRPYNLYERIEMICPVAFLPVVIQSHQLAPGVGGLSPNALLDGLDKIKAAEQPVVLATACRCHGVISAFNINSAPA